MCTGSLQQAAHASTAELCAGPLHTLTIAHFAVCTDPAQVKQLVPDDYVHRIPAAGCTRTYSCTSRKVCCSLTCCQVCSPAAGPSSLPPTAKPQPKRLVHEEPQWTCSKQQAADVSTAKTRAMSAATLAHCQACSPAEGPAQVKTLVPEDFNGQGSMQQAAPFPGLSLLQGSCTPLPLLCLQPALLQVQ